MEQSKQFNDVLALGRKLVCELKLEQSGDTLARWMAHHLAELIIATEQAKGDELPEFENRCREAILGLWEHLDVLPDDIRPLKNLEPLMATIKALDPKERAYFYQTQAQEAADNSELPGDAKEWLKLSRELDYSARLLIKMCLENAAKSSADENQEWFDLGINAFDDELPVVNILRILVDGQNDQTESNKAAVNEKVELLQDRRDRLHAMVKMADLLALDIEAQIKNLTS